jgi:hypothetical protein
MNDSLFRTQQFQKSAESYASLALEIPAPDRYKKMELRSPENGIPERDTSRRKYGQSPFAISKVRDQRLTLSCPR